MADSSFFFCNDHSFISVIQDELLSGEPNVGSNPYHRAFFTCHAVALLTFIVSCATGNLSQVDKLWSILPTIYAWMCIVDERTTLMACLSTLWSIRLTYNFYRRGGYSWPPWNGDEDYRWEILRRGTLGGRWRILTNKLMLLLFNMVFISVYQNYLLLYIASPSLVAWSMAKKGMHCPNTDGDIVGKSPPLNALDGVACFLFLIFLAVEAIADKQQYNFQTKKKEWMARSRAKAQNAAHQVYADGFCQSGLFSIVRKPNYAAEQAIWISYYLFSVAASYSGHSYLDHCWNWSGGGFILLCILFQGSGWLTEQITISKYPKYRSYQQKVPLYMPRVSSLWLSMVGIDKTNAKKD